MLMLAPFILASALIAPQEEVALDAAYWNQSYGNGAGSSSVEVTPIESAPEVLWHSNTWEFASDPVVWGTTILVATTKRGNLSLLALDAVSGEKRASVVLGRLENPQLRLAVWKSTVVVLDREQLRGFQFKGKSLRKKWKLEFSSTNPVAVAEGVLYVNNSERQLAAVDIERGKLIGLAKGGWGRPCVSDYRVVTGVTSPVDGYVGLYLCGFFTTKPSAGKRKFEWQPSRVVQHFGMTNGERPLPDDFTVVYAPDAAPYTELFFMRDGDYAALALEEGGPGFLALAEGHPVTYNGSFYTFGASGITRQGFDGKRYTLMGSSSYPPQAQLGPSSRAGHVVYSGNLAFDLDRKRVLWLKEDMPLGGPLIPLADGRALRRTDNNELVVFTAAGLEQDAAPGESIAVRAARPDAGSGLVLTNGEVLLGDVEITAAGGFELTPTKGEHRSFDRRDVALELGTAPTEATAVGPEYGVFLAWKKALEQALAEELAVHFAAYERAKLAGECNRLLKELDVLDVDRSADFTQRAANLRESTAGNAGLKRERTGRLELETRLRYDEKLVQAAHWCLDASLPEAATLLVLDAEDSLAATTDFHTTFAFKSARPPAPPGPLELPQELSLEALAPKNFPFPDASRGTLWGEWAREISPAGAHFIGAGDAAYPSRLVAPWTEATIVLSTRNMVLVSRCLDAKIVGSVLRNGEGGLELLAAFFDQKNSKLPRLEVRLHKNRRDYLGDGSARGWSLGYYSPGEHVSRFYVPDATESSGSVGIQQTLWQVVVHELTHQYVSERAGYRERQGSAQPGHWIIEGFARFTEEQSVELGRTTRGLDDPTVLSIDLTCELAKADALIPLERLLAMSYAGFESLGNEPRIKIEPRYSMGTYALDERSIYYSEAGALCFFLVNRRGPEGPPRLFDYLRARYEGSLPKEHWKLLGFESIAELDRAFRAFLADPR